MRRKWLAAGVVAALLAGVGGGALWWAPPRGGGFAEAAAGEAEVEARVVFDGDGVVWGFDFLSDDEVLATMRDGRLFYVNLADGTRREVAHGLSVAAVGQGGLLDVLAADGAVFLTYATAVEGGFSTALARGRWTGETLGDVRTVFVAEAAGSGGRHFGSRLAFDGEFLFMTIGDRGERDLAQSLRAHHGKILRLLPDGSPAPGNPFAEMPEALPEIWSLGHRNPQGIGFDAEGELYSVEFGPRGGDELNRVVAGENYGWPLISWGREYWGGGFEARGEGLRQPVTHWTPSVSPSGMVFYDGDYAAWRGDLFVACLGERHLRRVRMEDGGVVAEEVLFAELGERVRQVRSRGGVYFSTDSGKIFKVAAL